MNATRNKITPVEGAFLRSLESICYSVQNGVPPTSIETTVKKMNNAPGNKCAPQQKNGGAQRRIYVAQQKIGVTLSMICAAEYKMTAAQHKNDLTEYNINSGKERKVKTLEINRPDKDLFSNLKRNIMNTSDRSEAGILEKCRISITNTGEQSEIASAMAENGYDATEMSVGQTLLNNASVAYATNKTETDEEREAYKVFDNKRKLLDKQYTYHRKKAKVVFRKAPLILEKLGILDTKPIAYANWLEAVRKFYSLATSDADIQAQLGRLKVTPEELNEVLAFIQEVNAARAVYLKEKGESQEATAKKDAALSELDDWMRDFYSVARIALNDSPQLLEALGIIVRN